MEAPAADELIERYKSLLSHLLLRRAVEGPLPDKEEAQLAQGRADLWNEIPEDRQAALETWIDQQMRRTDILRPPVAEFVATFRRVVVAQALGAHDDSSEAVLDSLLGQMTEPEAEVVTAWRERERAVAPAAVGSPLLPFKESHDIRLASRERAA